jgi:hypothetical protein
MREELIAREERIVREIDTEENITRGKSIELHIVGICFAIAYGMLSMGLIGHAILLFVAPIPAAVWWILAIYALLHSALYSAFIGEVVPNMRATLLGGAAGLIVALFVATPGFPPYSMILPFAVGGAVASLSTVLFPRPTIFGGIATDVMVSHTITAVLVTAGAVYSLFYPWLQPVMLVLAACAMLLWSKWILRGCPLTFFEGKIRHDDGEAGDLWNQGFMATYGKRWFGVSLSDAFYENSIRIIAAGYAVYVLAGYFHWF